MVDTEEVFVTDLYRKYKGKKLYKGFYTVGKRIYQDDGKIVTKSIALDKEALEVFRARIIAILMDELPPSKEKYNTNALDKKGAKQSKLF